MTARKTPWIALICMVFAACHPPKTPANTQPVASTADVARRPAPPDEMIPAIRETPRRGADLPPASERAPAPELNGGVAWLNTDHPLRIGDLHGQVVVVDFWTYCCINCMHTLPVLAQLEARHRADPLMVIGVHSAKFPGEREADRIAEAVARYDVHHPVVVDQENAIWNRWNVHSWPTIVIIDAHGRIAEVSSGEPPLDDLDRVVNSLLAEGRADHSLSAQRIAIHAPSRPDTGPLAYPGKVISLGSDRIAFSDSGHDRIVVANINGTVETVIGAGIPGQNDGDFEHARFHHPQGLAAEPSASGQASAVLYVADTENHQIRRIDLNTQTVTTLAGAGALGSANGETTAAGMRAMLRSPWDLARYGDQLLIAMAGSHQIWTMDLAGHAIAPWLGSGGEMRQDGIALAAGFAQPSGLAIDGTTLFVADSETSSIRAVDLTTRAVQTLVGQDLFVFGDVDGAANLARLQHPLGVATVPSEHGVVYIADTYNHKIKRFDRATNSIRTIAGSTTRNPFFEPSGLTWTGTEFIVADTNHHRLVQLSRDGRTATPIVFHGLAAPIVQTVE